MRDEFDIDPEKWKEMPLGNKIDICRKALTTTNMHDPSSIKNGVVAAGNLIVCLAEKSSDISPKTLLDIIAKTPTSAPQEDLLTMLGATALLHNLLLDLVTNCDDT